MKTRSRSILLVLQAVLFLALSGRTTAATVTTCDEAGLRAALGGGGTINFACDGTITLTNTLTIAANTILDGSGRNVTISGNGAVRVFRVTSGVTLSLTNISVVDGFVVGNGAGVLNEGTVTLHGCTLSGNSILGGGGFVFVTGAAIHSPGRLTANACTFALNRAVPINSLPVLGGAIAAPNNPGPPSGVHGVWAFTNCTFYGNGPDAIGISQEGPVHVVNCTFAANTNAVVNGQPGFLVVPTVSLRNSIFVAGSGPNFVGAIVDAGHNLSSDDSGQFGQVFSIENVSPLLGPLADNGGPTLTMAPLPGSLAIDGGNDTVCLPLDQRGVVRPFGPNCDIGAVETTNAAPSPGVLHLGIATNTIPEADTNLVVNVSRAGGASGLITVEYLASPVTATAGSDFTVTQGTLTFNSGERMKSFILPIKQDTLVEGTETLNLVLSAPTGGAGLGRSSVPVTILDNDMNVAFASANYTAFESAGSATITAVRTGGTGSVVSVEYAAFPGTAIATDFQNVSGVLTFAAGQTNATFTVSLHNNANAEPNETVKLKLSNPTGGAFLGSIPDAVLTIRDDDRTNAVLTACDEASLRQALAQGGMVPVACDGTITLTNTIAIDVDAGIDATGHQFRLSGGGARTLFTVATNARFTLKNVTVADGSAETFASGIRNSGVLNVLGCTFSNNVASGMPVFGGAIYNLGTLAVDGCTFVSNRTAGWGFGTAIASGIVFGFGVPGGATYLTNSTFTWNRGGQTVIFKQGPAPGYLQNCTVATNDGAGVGNGPDQLGQGPFVLKNTIVSGNLGGNVSETTDAGNNISSDATGSFPSPTSRTNTDPRLSPLGSFGGRTPTMVLLAGSPALDAGDNSTGSSTDQRGVPRPVGPACDIGAVESTAAGIGFPPFYFSTASFAAAEFAGMAMITVYRNGEGTAPGSVSFATSGGSATAGQDYLEMSGTLNFAPGEVMKTFVIVLLDDTLSESTETIQLVLTDPTTGNPLVPPALATLSILDDDTVRIVNSCDESSLRAAMALGGRVQLTCDDVITLSSPITVANPVVLDATGHYVTISGGGAVRLFNVSASGKLTLLNLTLANGRAAGTNGSPGVAGGAGEGGGIYNFGSVVATNCVLWQNFALGGTGGPPNEFIFGPGGPARGGAVYNVEEGTIVAAGCTFVGNRADGGPLFPVFNLQSVAGGTGAGGAIYDAGGNVRLHQCVVLSNAATAAVGQRFGGQHVLDAAQGGGIFSIGGRIFLTDVRMVDNLSRAHYFSGANGGGISVLAGLLAVTNCHFHGNSASGGLGPGIASPFGQIAGSAYGGGIYVGSVSGFIDRTTISDCAAIGGSARIQGGMGLGGGVFCGTGGELRFSNCTLTHNQATAKEYYPAGVGGGICLSNGSTFLTHVTVADNSVATAPRLFTETRLGAGLFVLGGTLAMTNSIVANSLGASNCFGTVIDGGHNISSDSSCNFTPAGSLNNTDPILGPLTDYGGPTPTMALLAGSPAIDSAGAALCPPVDQRGIARPFGPGCDIGAFESAPPYTILGKVTGYHPPAAGIQVATGSTSNWVDAGGNFALHGLAPGSHLVIPSSPEAVFVLSNRLVNLGPDLVDLAFHSYRSNALVGECVSSGVVRIIYAAEAGQSYRVDVSQNMSWSPRSTHATATSGLFEFFDTNSSIADPRLFRVVKP